MENLILMELVYQWQKRDKDGHRKINGDSIIIVVFERLKKRRWKDKNIKILMISNESQSFLFI